MERVVITDEEQKCTIFLYLNEDNSFSGTKFFNDGRVEPVDNSVFDYFNMFKLSKNFTILPESGKYLVVQDNETNFKHFYLNGVEDYDMFFMYNGESALEYDEDSGNNGDKNNNKDNPEKKKKSVKKFRNIFKKVILVLDSAALAFILSPILKVPIYSAINFNDLTSKDALMMIENSSRIPTGAKKVLKQSNFFQTFLPYFNKSNAAKGNLRDSLADMKLNFLTNGEMWFWTSDNSGGFHISIYPNDIFILKGQKLKRFIDVLSHEFIHLCQYPNLRYSAISEAMAEQLSFEFFPLTEIDAYETDVSQLRKLMDLIGAEPFVEYYTTGSMASIENSIKPYLGEKGYNEFLGTLTIVREANKIFPWHDQTVKQEEQRVEKLEAIINDLAQKMGKEFRDHSGGNPNEPKHFYFNNDPTIRNLLSGISYDLKKAYEEGIITFSLRDEEGNLYKSLTYEETIERHKSFEESDVDKSEYDLVVAYNPDGESTWSWAGADIVKSDDDYVLLPEINYGNTEEYIAQFCDNTEKDFHDLFNVDQSLIDDHKGDYETQRYQMRQLFANLEAKKRYEKEESKITVFWINSKQLEINIHDNQVVIDPNLALQVFSGNREVVGKINNLLDLTEKDVEEELNKPVELLSLGGVTEENAISIKHPLPSSESDTPQATINTIYSAFGNYFAQYAGLESKNDVPELLNRYMDLIRTMDKDDEYETAAMEQDRICELSAGEVFSKNVLRSKIDEKGYNTIFVHRLQQEAEECGVENYAFCVEYDSMVRWYMLYVDDGEYYVANPTMEVDRDYEPGAGSWGHVRLDKFLSEYSITNEGSDKNCYFIAENFKDNPKSLDEIKVFPLPDFLEARELYRSYPDTVLSPENKAIIDGYNEAPGR